MGLDLSAVISNGVLVGPYIPWSKASVMRALDGKLVTGSGITLTIGNGFSVWTEFNVGDYTDPSVSSQTDGLGIGWEGFRGTLRLNPGSFTVSRIHN